MEEYSKPVVFSLGKELFGVDINLVQSIEKQMSIVSVPNSISYVNGIINLRGEVVPVYSLDKKLNIKSENQQNDLIIVAYDNVKIALEVDEVLQIQEITKEDITAMPRLAQTEDTRFLERVARSEDKLIILLDVKKLLTKKETEDVIKFTEDISKNK